MGWACHRALVWDGPANLPNCFYLWAHTGFGLFWRRSAAMSGSDHRAALPPEVPYYGNSRRSTTRSPRNGARPVSRQSGGSSIDSPLQRQEGHGRRHSVNNPRRRREHARARASPHWQVVLDELATLKGVVAKLTSEKASSQLQQVNFQASTSGTQPPVSPNAFSGFLDSSSEEGEVKEVPPGSRVLLQAAKAFRPLDGVSVDIDPQVAAMVNFWFDKGLQEEDNKEISEDPVTRRPNNCPALETVECNPQILGALKPDARKADSRLKDISADIISAGSIITKSLVVLDKVAQDAGNSVVAQEVAKVNGALALQTIRQTWQGAR